MMLVFSGDRRVSPLYIHARIGHCVFLGRLMRVVAKDGRHPRNQKSKADSSTWPFQPIWNLSHTHKRIYIQDIKFTYVKYGESNLICTR